MASSTKLLIIPVGLSELQLHLYKTILTRDLEIINNDATVNDATLLGTVIQLKQCCAHPYLFDGMETEQTEKERSQSLDPETITTHHLIKNCGKLFVMDKLISKIRNDTNTILLCSQIKEMFEWFEAYCNQRGISHCTICNDNQPRQDESNTECDILIHDTSNTDAFYEAMISNRFSNIDSVIFYDTDWSIKHKEDDIIRILEGKCVEKEGLNVYKICTKDTLEERLCSMEQKEELSTKELKALIRYKATQIMDTERKSTLNIEEDIEDILRQTIYETEGINNEEEKVESPTKYTLKDIMNHPENQGVIGVFLVFFISMIIVPLITVLCLNKYVMEYVLLDWSDTGKQNITVVIGVGIAQLIGIIYVCYAWSGEDRIPARLLEKKNEDISQNSSDVNDRDDGAVGTMGQNVLRKRKTNKRKTDVMTE